MVLAFAEPNPATGIIQLKWLSSDKAMIVTENGRIIKTIGLPQINLMGLEARSEQDDTIVTFPSFHSILKKQAIWQANYQWQTKNHYLYNYHADITPMIGHSEQVSTFLGEQKTTIIYENISFNSLEASFTNRYWVSNQGDVIKTEQYLGPKLGKIEMTILKPFSL